MNYQKEFEEAVNTVGYAFSRLVAIAFTGNGAKMREALEALSAWAKVVKKNPKDKTAIECAEFVEETIKAALAAPRRMRKPKWWR